MPEKSRAKAYRIKATECARAALTTTELDIKAIYQDLAMQWRELALRAAEKIQRNITGSRLRTRLDEGARLVSELFSLLGAGFRATLAETIRCSPAAGH